LTEAEKVLFRRLSVFSGSFDLESVTEVCAGDGIEPWQVLDLLTFLVDKSLVVVEDHGAIARYRLLETVRLYAGRWLDAAGELGTAKARHFEHFARLAEMAAPAVQTAEAPEWFERLDDDYPDLDAALNWARGNGDLQSICRLVSALAFVWAMGGTNLNVPAASAMEWMDLALESDMNMTPQTRGMLIWARCTIGFTARWQLGGQDRMLALAHEGLELARSHGDDLMLGRFLSGVGQAMMHTKESRPFLEEGLAASERAGDDFMIAFAHAALTLLWFNRDPPRGRYHCSEAVRIGLGTRNLAAVSGGTGVTGVIHLLEGRPLEAIDWLSRGYEFALKSRFAFGVVVNEGFRSLAYATAAMWAEAEVSIDNHRDLGRRTGLGLDPLSLQSQALLLAQQGRHDEAMASATEAMENTPPSSSLEFAYATLITVELAANRIEAATRHVKAWREMAAVEELVFSQARADMLDARLQRRLGDRGTAWSLAASALGAALHLDAPGIAVDVLEVLAGLAHDAGDDETAARLFGATHAARATTGYQLCLSERDADRTAIWEKLGEQYGRLTDEGAALSISDAASYAT
jgi:tetratricopeptide (TPR) repeat protein